MNWTKFQQDVIDAVAGGVKRLIVDAKAGCGKTTLMVKGVLPVIPARKKVLYTCFGNLNKDDAAEKIGKQRNIMASVDVSTFHSAGFSIVKAQWGRKLRLDNWREFGLTEKLGWNKDTHYSTIRCIANTAQKCKELFCTATPSEEDIVNTADRFDFYTSAVEKEGVDLSEVVENVLAVLRASLVQDWRVSFADMIWLSLVKGWVKPVYDVVIIDECQDLNSPQIELAIRLCKPEGQISVVGDPNQAIFAFRGADSESMNRLKEEFGPEVQVLPLPETFRCGKKIVEMARELVPGYIANEGNPEGEILEICSEELLEKVSLGDVILSRTNAPLTGYCLKLLRAGIKANIQGRDIGKNLMSLCDSITRKRNLKIVPFLEKVSEYLREQEERLVNKRNAEQLISDMHDKVECLEVLSDGLQDTNELKARIKGMFQDKEKFGRKGQVTLSSIHRAKGMEFSKVFGLWNTLRDHNQEELNLQYVLITRAINTLVKVHNED